MLHRPVPHLEEHLADLRMPVGEPIAQGTAHHAADDAVLVDPVARDIQSLDRPAVADDRDRVGDLLDLVELVRNHDETHAPALEPPHQVEQVLGVRLVERRGGLVEDEQLHRLVERLRNLHQLLLADTQVLDLRVGIVAETDPGEQLSGALLRLDPVDDTEPARLVAEEDVLGDGQLGDEGELLMDDDDPGLLARFDVAEADLRTLEHDLARVGPVGVDAGEYLHQGGLARAVLSADGVDLSSSHGEGDLVESLDPGEGLRDGPHLENDIAHTTDLFRFSSETPATN